MENEEVSLKSFDHHSRKHSEYFELYDKHFKNLREKKLNILEIGVQYGGSVEMWAKYFPNAHITGIDIDPVCKIHAGKRVSIKIGDQTDRAFLSQFKNYDIIIDDGGHTMRQQQTSFEVLFPLLNPGGIYVLEDLHTSYWPAFFDKKPTTMEYLATMTHTLNAGQARATAPRGGRLSRARRSAKCISIQACAFCINKWRNSSSGVSSTRRETFGSRYINWFKEFSGKSSGDE